MPSQKDLIAGLLAALAGAQAQTEVQSGKNKGKGPGTATAPSADRSFRCVASEFNGVAGLTVEKVINGAVAKRKFVTSAEAMAIHRHLS